MKRIIVYSIIIFVFSIGIGYYYSKLWKIQNISEIENLNKNTIVTEETAFIEEKVSHDATLALKKYYNECGHFKFNYVELPSEFVNLTEKEIKEMYPEWMIEEFCSDNLVLAQNIDNICDEHYILKLGDNNIEIYKMIKSNNFELVKETNISKEYLTVEDIKRLEEGIFVFGVSDLNSALEDFE